MEELKYPIGRFQYDQKFAIEHQKELIQILEELPVKLENKLASVTSNELEKNYRLGGWTIRQIVHHLADSHANMYIRVKSALTHTGIPVMGYDEAAWATFVDNDLPLEISIQMLRGIHARVCYLFNHLAAADWEKTYFHNADKRLFTLQEVLALYAWHSAHHLAHIDLAKHN